jgi:hypothetical protein
LTLIDRHIKAAPHRSGSKGRVSCWIQHATRSNAAECPLAWSSIAELRHQRRLLAATRLAASVAACIDGAEEAGFVEQQWWAVRKDWP